MDLLSNLASKCQCQKVISKNMVLGGNIVSRIFSNHKPCWQIFGSPVYRIPEQPLYIWWIFLKCNALKVKPFPGDRSFA